ncbi:hypothetical protein, partial [Magnetospirillum moscoviense]|uniref:hypothetical protein n=1 Tax=Magnetospirillum moscoviense TaxID=1437059 RepID=UPI001FE152B9
ATTNANQAGRISEQGPLEQAAVTGGIRLSRPVEPFWSGRPMIKPDIPCHRASSNTRPDWEWWLYCHDGRLFT